MDLVHLFPLILISVLGNVVEGTQDRGGSRNLKIVGGRYARQGQFPHLVSLQLVRRGGNPTVHFCGGSILQSSHLVTHSVHVLTAAHCCEHVFNNRHSEDTFQVVAGELNLNSQSGHEQIVNVMKIKMHPGWDFRSQIDTRNRKRFGDDVCLLRLQPPGINLSYLDVKPITLAKLPPPSGKRCSIAGWGATYYGQGGTPQLQWLELPILDNHQCSWQPMYKPVFNKTAMLCAGFTTGGRDSCSGDSGGGLSCDGQLVGVVSFGHKCAEQGYPGVYANVPFYKHWIENEMSNGFRKLSSSFSLSIAITIALSLVWCSCFVSV